MIKFHRKETKRNTPKKRPYQGGTTGTKIFTRKELRTWEVAVEHLWKDRKM
jgi:hypothetical protein